MSTENFIDALAADNKAAAKDAFESEISSRVTSALDAKKVEVAQTMFNQVADSNEDAETV